jgi:hypothetical protein
MLGSVTVTPYDFKPHFRYYWEQEVKGHRSLSVKNGRTTTLNFSNFRQPFFGYEIRTYACHVT